MEAGTRIIREGKDIRRQAGEMIASVGLRTASARGKVKYRIRTRRGRGLRYQTEASRIAFEGDSEDGVVFVWQTMDFS